MSGTAASLHGRPDLAKRPARDGRAAYGSSMCSISARRPAPPSSPSGPRQPGEPAGPAGLDRLGRAIDELADAARAQDGAGQDSGRRDGTGRDGTPTGDAGQDGAARDVATRLARVWEMVAELDPELARRLAGYGS